MNAASSSESGQVVLRRTPRWVWALLIFSLSFNLLIVGVVLGSIWAVRKGGYWQAPIAFERSQRFMGALPEARRREIRAIFFEYRTDLKPYWQNVRQARISIARLIEGGTYSQDALNEAMTDLFQKEESARMAAKPMIAAMLAKLNADERVHFLRVFLPYLDEAHSLPNASSAD